MKSRTIRMVGVAAITALAATIGFGGTASAQAEDVPIIAENLPEAAEILADGLQEAVTAAAEHQSAVQASADIGQVLVASGTALVAGTEQFGSLGLGLLLVNLGAQQALAPYLGAIDDPETAADLFDPNDLQVIGGNAEAAADHVSSNLATALAEGLKGNVLEAGFLDPATGTPALFGNTAAIVGDLQTGGTLFILFQGSSLEEEGAFVGIAGLIGGAVVGGATAEYLQQVEDGIAPAAEAAEPATAPIIEALEGL